MRVERIPCPAPPGPGMALLRATAVGVCGSDLHSYIDARIGDTPIGGPLILGHEFSATVEALGSDSLGGQPRAVEVWHAGGGGSGPAVPPLRILRAGPSQPLLPVGLLRQLPLWRQAEWMHMPARSCFPVPKALRRHRGGVA